MDSAVFAEPKVRALAETFHRVKLYIDGPGEEANALLLAKRFGTSTIPFWAVLAPDGRELGRIEYTLDPAEFLAFLSAGR